MKFNDEYLRGYWKFNTFTFNFDDPIDPVQELIFGLCYGDVYNQYPSWELWDEYKRRHLNDSQKQIVIAYLKERYSYWKNDSLVKKFAKKHEKDI